MITASTINGTMTIAANGTAGSMAGMFTTVLNHATHQFEMRWCKWRMMENLKRISAFLSQYVRPIEGSAIIPADEAHIKDAIEFLVTEGMMTVDEIRLEALDEFDVIIPYYLLPNDGQE